MLKTKKNKTRVKGDVLKKFSINFSPEDGDQFFIIFKEKRFPKDRKERGLPPETLDYIQSAHYNTSAQAEMFTDLYRKGDISIKIMLGQFINNVILEFLNTRCRQQVDKEKELKELLTKTYEATHNGAVSGKANNLSSKE